MICIGHRGARGYAPENTLGSVEIAIAQGAQWVEIDVRAHQGALIVLHDDYLDRTCNGSGHIRQYSLAQIRQFDAGNGEQIPLLDEVFELVNRRAGINIELKDSASAPLVQALIEQFVARGWPYQQILVSSFFHHDLQWLKSRNSQILIGALSSGVGIDYAKFAADLNAWSINLCAESINQAIINDAHNRGLKVMVYTVNEQAQFLELQKMAVDGIFTDYPLKMLQWLN